jgi:formylmethanofuran dehydrogenase subunit D
MQWLKVCLVTGRTVEQGCGKERGKISNRYFKNVAVCELNKKDMRNLEIHDGNPVRVSTEFGSVVLFAKTSRRIKVQGTAFVPYGLWVNQVLTSDTDSTGMPLLKGISADVEPTDKPVLSLEQLLFQIYGEKKGLMRD